MYLGVTGMKYTDNFSVWCNQLHMYKYCKCVLELDEETLYLSTDREVWIKCGNVLFGNVNLNQVYIIHEFKPLKRFLPTNLFDAGGWFVTTFDVNPVTIEEFVNTPRSPYDIYKIHEKN